jgi:hypothetical protein
LRPTSSHPNSVAVYREHRRAKTDRLDTELLKRVFLSWLRGESDHCSMAAIPTLGEEDDMPAHVKAMLNGVSLHVPVTKGKMTLGTWQGIYVAEHRARPHRREVVLQFLGCCDQTPRARSE